MIGQYSNQNLSKLSKLDPVSFWINTPMGYYIGNLDFGLPFEWIVGKNMEHKNILMAMILDKMAQDLGNSIYGIISEVKLTKEDTDEIKLEIRYNNKKEFILVQQGV